MEKRKKTQQKPNKTKKKAVLEKSETISNSLVSKPSEAKKIVKYGWLHKRNAFLLSSGIDPKTEWLQFGIVSFVFLALCFLVIWTKNYYLLIPSLAFYCCYLYLFFQHPDSVIKKKRIALRMEFVRLFSFFRIFLDNGHSVYGALLETRVYAKGEMLSLFDRLIEEIDANKTIEPYLHFADAFDSIEIKQALIATYELSLDGGKDRFEHFSSVFTRVSDEKRDEDFDRFKNKLANLNFLPLVGSAFSMALVAIAVIILMGSNNYGI